MHVSMRVQAEVLVACGGGCCALLGRATIAQLHSLACQDCCMLDSCRTLHTIELKFERDLKPCCCVLVLLARVCCRFMSLIGALAVGQAGSSALADLDLKGSINKQQFKALLQDMDSSIRALPATAQVR